MYPQLRGGFRLGSFDVLPLQNEIVGPDGTRHIQPKAMDVLCCLVVNAGEVVERDAILREVWERNVVADDVLTRCISELRHALGDSVAAAKYIQTVPKRGYRLVAETGPLSAPPPAPQGAATGEYAVVGAPAPRSFWQEVKQRSVVRVGLAYAALAWLIIEVTETIFPYLRLPPSANGFVVIVALLGFPVALALAWVFEITPGGIVVDDDGDAASAQSPRRHTTRRLRRLDVITVGAAAILAAIIGFQYFGTGRDLQSAAPALQAAGAGMPDRKSIAIMPFDNLSGAADKEYFGDGLAEDLIHLLTKARKLRVSPRAASFFYKNKDIDIQTIAERLKVGTVLTGSVRISADNIIVVVQLQDLETTTTLWTERIVRPLGDLFALQNEIAEAVVENLRIELDANDPDPLQYRAPTEILGAYQFFSQAREYLRRPLEEANIASAEALLQRALELDPGYADAYALLCETHLARYTLSYVSDTRAFENAERHCFRAKTLDSTNVNVYVALGALYRHSGQYDKAIDEVRAALAQSPFLVPAQIELGLAQREKGDFERAEQSLRRAVDMDPGYFLSYNELGNLFFAQQRYEDAAEFFRAVTELTPTSKVAHNNLAGAYFMLNDFDRAAQSWEQSLALGGTRSTYTNLGLSNYYAGRFAKAVEMQQRAVEITPNDHRIWGRLAESARFVSGMESLSQDAYRKAIGFAQERLQVNPRDWETLGLLALYQAHVVEAERALSTLGRGLAVAPREPDMHYFAALVYLELDNEDAAFTELQTALELGFSPRLVRADPDIQPLLAQERFQALLTP